MKTDIAWKFIIDELLPQFIHFFMPDLYDLVDFSIKPRSLDNEFSSLFPESKSEDRRVDKLFEVHLKNGKSKWILLNIEIQSYEDSNFAKRMYQHYARIFDKFDKEIDAIVIYTYKSDRHKYKKYESEFLETKLSYEFRSYDIAEQKIEELEKIKNPFSFIMVFSITGAH
ncbi:MAG: Rpn family recombination-promoting nuclease/putative transposase [Candidatus Sericytochromatia bacterium]